MPKAFIEVIPVGPLQANCSILGDMESTQAMVIDPGGHADRILDICRKQGLTITHIVLTHGHVDHVAGVRDLLQALPNPKPKVYLHPDDGELYQHSSKQAALFGLPEVEIVDTEQMVQGQELMLGDEIIQVLHTPGHSPGSVSLYWKSQYLVVCGDLLFAGSIGRTDLWGGDFEVLKRAVHERIFSLPEATRVITGHGPDTQVGRERSSNPFVGDHSTF